MRLAKKRTTCILALQLLALALPFVCGLRGQAKWQDGLAVRQLTGTHEEAEDAGHEIAETFTTKTDKASKTKEPPISYHHGNEMAKERSAGKDKSEKAKMNPHSFAPKQPKEGTSAPKGSPQRPAYPAQKPTKKEGGKKQSEKATKSDEDHDDYYDYYYDYYDEKEDKNKDSETGKKAPKGIKGNMGSKNGNNNKNDKGTGDKAKAPKGGKNENKDKSGKNKMPKFPGDDDDYHDPTNGGEHDGAGMATSAPTVSPTEPKDSRNADDEEDNQGGGRGDYDGGDTDNTNGRGDGDADADDGSQRGEGGDDIPELPDYTGVNGGGESSRALNLIIPIGSALGVLLLCGGFVMVRRNRRERTPGDIREFEAKIQHHAEEGTMDGTTEMSDARTFTFSDDGIERYRRQLALTGKSDKSSTIDEELRGAMESLEDFEEVSLHEDENEDEENQGAQNSTSLSKQLSQGAFQAVSTLGLFSGPVPPIQEAVSNDDSSTSDIYVANKQDSFEESENEYESYSNHEGAHAVQVGENEEVEAKEEEENEDLDENQRTDTIHNKAQNAERLAEAENQVQKDVIDLTLYENEGQTNVSGALEPEGLAPEDEEASRDDDSQATPLAGTAAMSVSTLSSPTSLLGDRGKEADYKGPTDSGTTDLAPATPASTVEPAVVLDEAKTEITKEPMDTEVKTTKSEEGTPDTKEDNRPEWMKKSLRAKSTVSRSTPPPKEDEEKVPEWMLKYKQMRFQKVDE